VRHTNRWLAGAVVVDGRRAAPPEDAGGAVDAASLAMVLDDPVRFDRDEINEALRNPYFVLREYGVDQRLVDLVHRLRYTSIGEDLAARSLTLVSERTRPAEDELVVSLRAYLWFLDRAEESGIELTSAGYLKPADVEAASLVVPAMGDWIGKNNRESLAAPLLDFRQSLQATGLLRRYKGTLLLTRAGANAQRDPRRLWDLLADKLVPNGDGFENDATLLLLAYAASSADTEIPLAPIAEASPTWAGGTGTAAPSTATNSTDCPRSTPSSTSPSGKPISASAGGSAPRQRRSRVPACVTR